MSEKDMNIQLFVTDLDGTLLPTGKDVPQVNIDAVQRAVKAGVTVTIATGRMYRAALPVAQAIGVDVPIITYNGALIKGDRLRKGAGADGPYDRLGRAESAYGKGRESARHLG